MSSGKADGLAFGQEAHGWSGLQGEALQVTPVSRFLPETRLRQPAALRLLLFHPEWRRSPGEGHGSPLQYSCLESPMGRGAWWVTTSQTQLKQLSTYTHVGMEHQPRCSHAQKVPSSCGQNPAPLPLAGDSKEKGFMMSSLWCSGLFDACVN